MIVPTFIRRPFPVTSSLHTEEVKQIYGLDETYSPTPWSLWGSENVPAMDRPPLPAMAPPMPLVGPALSPSGQASAGDLSTQDKILLGAVVVIGGLFVWMSRPDSKAEKRKYGRTALPGV